METITVLDVGSHTLKAGLPYNFPSLDDPTVVINQVKECHAEADEYCWSRTIQQSVLLLQVTPSYVMPAADPGAEPNGTEVATLQPVMDRGFVANWEGLEALLYGVLYGEVLTCGSTCRHARDHLTGRLVSPS